MGPQSIAHESDGSSSGILQWRSMPAQLEDLYSLTIPLGRNITGAVWQAEPVDGGDAVAVAVLDLEHVQDPELRRRATTRFRRDVGLLRNVDHPNIVRIVGVGRSKAGHPYAAMELIEGVGLDDWLDQERSGAERIRLATAILTGLEAAHHAGVVHGDLEPGNVLVQGDDTPKLIAFGLNRTLARQAHPGWQENSGVCRSLVFSAPEQAEGTGGRRADVYGAGMLLHQVCSGALPLGGRATLREGAPRLPAGLAAVIERALSKDPAERHPTVGRMRRAWVDAASVGRKAIEAAHDGFGPEPALGSGPMLGLIDADDEGSDEGRPSVMSVGIALADEDEERDSKSLAHIGIPFADEDDSSDAVERLSLTDVLDYENEADEEEMRLSMSDVLPDPRPVRAHGETTMRIPRPKAQRNNTPWIVALVLGVAMVGTALVIRGWGTRQVDEDTRPTTPTPPISLGLVGVPEDATVWVDGEPVSLEGDAIEFPGDGEAHEVTVRLDGYTPWSRTLATQTPIELLVRIEGYTPSDGTTAEEPNDEQTDADATGDAAEGEAPEQTVTPAQERRDALRAARRAEDEATERIALEAEARAQPNTRPERAPEPTEEPAQQTAPPTRMAAETAMRSENTETAEMAAPSRSPGLRPSSMSRPNLALDPGF